MPCAYVLFNVSSGSEDRVLEKLRRISGVEETFFSYGIYDLVIKIKADSMEQLNDLLSHRLRVLDDVKSTITLIQAEEKKLVVNV
jgi:DNA-binding Lrp family transcriptional regulator